MSNSQRFSSKSIPLRVFTFLLILSLMSLLPPAQPVFSAPDATYTVNNSGDLPDDDLDDGVCDTSDAAPGEQCTLRAAIQQANVPNSGHDTILFNGFRVIAPSSELPALSHSSGTTIYSDDQVFLSGTNVSAGDGLTLDSDGNKVMGLVIFLFDNGIMVTGDDNIIGTDGDGVNDTSEKNVIQNNASGYGLILAGNNNVVAGNHIGVDIAGTSAAANTTGIFVSGNNNRIGTDGDGISDTLERNIISGNTQFGLDISGDDTVVAGNYIGINSAGTAAIANGSHGVDIDVLALGTRVGTNSDGSGDTVQRNFISGNGGNGITTKGDDVTIAGNYIGTNAAGTSAIPNSGYGVAVGNFSYQTVVGTNGDGTRDSIEGNLISGNTSGGVKVSGDSRQVTVIAGNLIGTNPAGTAALGNGGDGIYAEGLGGDLVVGTNGDGLGDVYERNIISGNGQDGIHLSVDLSSAEIAGNYIGTNVMGNSAIGNAANGVLLDDGANHNIIGTDRDNSADTLERNIISGNAQSGVRIEGNGSDTNFVRGNYIGTNASGNSALANQIGVRVDDQAYLTVIGDEFLGDFGNVISGNTNDGIFIGSNCEATEIWKNVIGLNYLGMTAVSNGRNGIYLTAGAFELAYSIQYYRREHRSGYFYDTDSWGG